SVHISLEALISGQPTSLDVAPDGSFEIEGLLARTYDVIAGTRTSDRHRRGGEIRIAVRRSTAAHAGAGGARHPAGRQGHGAAQGLGGSGARHGGSALLACSRVARRARQTHRRDARRRDSPCSTTATAPRPSAGP